MNSPEAPVVAAFDLDGTLTKGGSVFHWLQFIAGGFATWRAALRLVVPLAIGALRSGPSADDAKQRLFASLLHGRDEAELRTRSSIFAIEHLASKSRGDIVARLRWHRRAGHHVVIVSASPQMYVDVVAQHLEAHGALGTRLAVDERGRLTGKYLGENCRGEEKMRRLDEWIATRDFATPPVVYAYGNSRGDRRLLERADHPFDVGRLGPVGALRKFPRLVEGASYPTAGGSTD